MIGWLAGLFHKVERFLFYMGLVQKVHTVLDGVLRTLSLDYRKQRQIQAQSKRLEIAPTPRPVSYSSSTSPPIGVMDDEALDELLDLFEEAYEREPLNDSELSEFARRINYRP